MNDGTYSYNYDNIGNRNTAQEITEEVTNYTANNLNQYTAIGDFAPTYDAAGNQTLVKTTTGIWTVAYDAENRPVSFTNAETNTVIECSYDYMSRRATKKVTVDGSITLHQCYLYRGYLQIACCDLTRSNHPALWLITWDPTQPIATRPLAIQKDATWYTYGWDLTKNICELYGSNGYIRTTYTYTPYGEVTESANSIYQPIQWSSEFNDTELGLVYYNYRHYNPLDGRWIGRDKIGGIEKIYTYCENIPTIFSDLLGNGSLNLCDYELISIAISSKDRIKISTKSLGKAAEKIAEKLTREILYQIIKNINPAAKVLEGAATLVDLGLHHGYVVYGYRCECDNYYTVGIEKISGNGLGFSRDRYTIETTGYYWLDVSIKRSEIKSLVESICCK